MARRGLALFNEQMKCIAFKRRNWWERLLMLIPAYRNQEYRKLKAGIEQLMRDPALPCQIEEQFIPDGYGGQLGVYNPNDYHRHQ
jgi:hypothetical protein